MFNHTPHCHPMLRVVAFSAVVAALAGCGRSEGQTSQGGSNERPPPEVGVVSIETRELVIATELPGRTTASEVAAVRPQVSGIIRERRFNQGADVDAGDTLYQIEDRRYQAELERARSRVASARAAIPQLEKRKERRASLVKKDAVSQQEYEDTVAALDQARAEVQVARAELRAARIDVDYTTVEAPIDGRVGPTQVTTGALVNAGQEQALTRVTKLDPIYVDIQRSVAEVRRLRRQAQSGQLETNEAGQTPVHLQLPEGGTYPHTGRLAVSDVSVDPETGSVTLRAEFPNPDHTLLPGMYVRAQVSEGTRTNAILAPQQGVGRDARGRPTALVVADNDTVIKRDLTVSRAIGSFWLIEDGLKAGDRLIVSGLQKISAQDEVRTVASEIDDYPTSTLTANTANGDDPTKTADQGGDDG